MMRALILALLMLASPATAQDAMDHGDMSHHEHGPHQPAEPVDDGSMDHSAHGQAQHGDMQNHSAAPEGAVPPRALEGPRHAADTIYGEEAMAPARDRFAEASGEMLTGRFLVERLEARIHEGEDAYLWDAEGWYGGDIDKLYMMTKGEDAFGGDLESAELQALWSHAIGPYFDLQAGARYDFEPDDRAYAVLGVQGLAPYMIHLDAAAFLSNKGDVTARIEGEYDQRITQRLILQPRAELELSAQDIVDQKLGSGFTSIEAGLRLRYEIAREFAPYIGVGYEAKLGETADIAEAAGEDSHSVRLLLGIRAWF